VTAALILLATAAIAVLGAANMPLSCFISALMLAARAAVAKVYGKANGGTIHLDRSTSGGSVYIHQFMLKMHFPAIDLVAERRSVGELVTIRPSASGECLGAIDDTNLLVWIGQGDPMDCRRQLAPSTTCAFTKPKATALL